MQKKANKILADAKNIFDNLELTREQLEYLMDDINANKCEQTLKPLYNFLKKNYKKIEEILYNANETLNDIDNII